MRLFAHLMPQCVSLEGYGKMAYTKRCIYAIQEAFIPSMCPVACDGILGSPSPFLCGIIVSKDTKTIQNWCRYPPHLLQAGRAWCDPPYARSMHQSYIGSSMYVLNCAFGLCCSIFHGFSWVLQCVFYNFASPICKKYAPFLYWKVPCMF